MNKDDKYGIVGLVGFGILQHEHDELMKALEDKLMKMPVCMFDTPTEEIEMSKEHTRKILLSGSGVMVRNYHPLHIIGTEGSSSIPSEISKQDVKGLLNDIAPHGPILVKDSKIYEIDNVTIKSINPSDEFLTPKQKREPEFQTHKRNYKFHR